MPRGVKRKEKDIEALVRTLEPALQRGVKLKTACYSLKVPYVTMLEYMEKHEWVRTRIRGSEAMFESLMTNSVYESAKEDGKLALDVLRAIDKNRWSTRQEIKSENINHNIEITDEEAEAIRALEEESKRKKSKSKK